MYAAHQKGTSPNFRQRPLSAVRCSAGAASEWYIEEKQTELETESK